MVDIADAVTHTNFGDHRLRGFCVAGGQISPSPIDFHRRPYKILALPCECMIGWISCRTTRPTAVWDAECGLHLYRCLQYFAGGVRITVIFHIYVDKIFGRCLGDVSNCRLAHSLSDMQLIADD